MALGNKSALKAAKAVEKTPAVNENPLVVKGFKEWFREHNYVSIAPVMNINKKNYPFITFLTNEVDENGRAIAENIYITKKSATNHPDVFYKDAEVNIELLRELSAVQVAMTDEAFAGQLVWRLCVKGESSYLDLEELFADED